MNTIFDMAAGSKPAAKPAQTEVKVVADIHAELMLESAQLDVQMAMLDNSIEKIEELQELANTAAQFATTGLSQDGAVFFTTQAERIRKQLCVPQAITSSMEDFAGTKTDSVDALGASMEAIGDVASNAWEAVINFLKDMYEKVATFITKLFDNMPNLKKRAEAIKERAGDTDGTAKDKIKFSKMGRIASAKNEFKFENFKNVENLFTLKCFANMVEIGKSDNFEKLEGSAEDIAKLMPKELLEKTEYDKVAGDLTTANASDYSDGSPAAQMFGADLIVAATPLLPGMKHFMVSRITDDKLGEAEAKEENRIARLKALTSVKFGFKDAQKEVKHDSDKEYTALTTSQVEDICDIVITGCDAFAKSKGSIESGRKAVQKLTKVAEKLKNNAGKTEYKDVKGTMNAAKSAIMKCANLAGNPNRELAGYFHGVAGAGLDFCEASLKAHKKD